MNRPDPLVSMLLHGCHMYNQKMTVTSEDALAPTFWRGLAGQ